MEQPKAWIVIAILMIFPYNCLTMDYSVGNSQHWDLGIDYASWASGKTFHAGDQLVFTYTVGMHDVLEVSKAAYDSCDATNPTKTYTGGSNAITLGSAGAKYFICGIPGHCSAGMKLAVSVAASTPAVSPSSNRTAAVPALAPVPSPSPTRTRPGVPTPSPSPSPSASTPDVGSPSPASSPSISAAPAASASTPSAAASGGSPSVNGTEKSAAAPSFPKDGVVVLAASLLFGHALISRMFSP